MKGKLSMIKKIWKIVVAFFMALIVIMKIAFRTIALIWNSLKDGNMWFAIFYQPVLVLINLMLLYRPIECAILNGDTRLLMIIIIAFASLTLTFIENAAIELNYHLRNRSTNYEALLKLQQYFNNYALIIISLAALFVGAFPSNSESANFGLLVFGILYFLTTVYSDAYRIFISEKGDVKKLATQIKDMWIDD